MTRAPFRKGDLADLQKPSHPCRVRRPSRRLRRATAPAPVVTAPPPKPLDAKTQLENHM